MFYAADKMAIFNHELLLREDIQGNFCGGKLRFKKIREAHSLVYSF